MEDSGQAESKTEAPNKTIVHEGERVSVSVRAFPHKALALNDTGIVPNESVLSPDQRIAVQQVFDQRRDLIAEEPAVLCRDELARANALKDQSAAFSDLGRRDGALASMTQATNSFRALAAKHPEAFNVWRRL